jgi:hypothetical protein
MQASLERPIMEEIFSGNGERAMLSERKAERFGSQVSQTYEIRVQAYLDPDMLDWLGDFTICHEGDAETVLTGVLPDQPALFGLLLRLHSLGIPLISVNSLPVEADGAAGRERNK